MLTRTRVWKERGELYKALYQWAESMSEFVVEIETITARRRWGDVMTVVKRGESLELAVYLYASDRIRNDYIDSSYYSAEIGGKIRAEG